LASSDLVPRVPFDIDIPSDRRQVDISVTPAAAAHLTAYSERRLADEALLAAIREVGLEPVPLGE
jgi:hypothetical protein